MKRFTVLASAVALMGATGMANAVNPHVNLELSLLVDISGSIDATEYALQKTGYVNAFQAANFYSTVVGAGNSIAVNFVEWSGAGQQQQLVGWTIINSQASANAFAAAIAGSPRPWNNGNTSPGEALTFAAVTGGAQNIFANNIDSDRQIIDVSGDGAENVHNDAFVDAARTAAVNAGVDQINGLVILGEAGLEAWYNAHIRTANGFVSVASGFDSFGAAIANKINIEVSQGVPLPSAAGMGLAGLGLVGLRRRR